VPDIALFSVQPAGRMARAAARALERQASRLYMAPYSAGGAGRATGRIPVLCTCAG